MRALRSLIRSLYLDESDGDNHADIESHVPLEGETLAKGSMRRGVGECEVCKGTLSEVSRAVIRKTKPSPTPTVASDTERSVCSAFVSSAAMRRRCSPHMTLRRFQISGMAIRSM
jgi:hypothetical protein